MIDPSPYTNSNVNSSLVLHYSFIRFNYHDNFALAWWNIVSSSHHQLSSIIIELGSLHENLLLTCQNKEKCKTAQYLLHMVEDSLLEDDCIIAYGPWWTWPSKGPPPLPGKMELSLRPEDLLHSLVSWLSASKKASSITCHGENKHPREPHPLPKWKPPRGPSSLHAWWKKSSPIRTSSLTLSWWRSATGRASYQPE